MDHLENTLKLANYYRSLGEKTFQQLTEEELLWSPGIDSNSIAVIVKHLWGNMLSRWTNFLDEDGEKPWRRRDEEFENDIGSREELLSKWNEGWNCFLGTLKGLSNDDLVRRVYIRNEGHSVYDAILRQMCHYSSHIGQIIYLGKIIKGEEWQSLSIPKGESEKFNTAKFSTERTKRHFTDDA